MKRINFRSAIVAGALAIANIPGTGVALAADSHNPEEVRNIKVARVFTPKGLDSNDNSVVVLDGYLPDGCYRITKPEVQVNDATKTISFQARANYFNVPCIEALVPFTQEVELGMLSPGHYRIQSKEGREMGALLVAKAESKYPDDFLYAPVEVLLLDQKETNPGEQMATLRGRFTNSCMFLDHVATKYFPDSIEILPVMGMRKGDCAQVEVPFAIDVALDANRLTEGRMLVHARSLNGRWVSAMLNVMSY